MGNCFNGNDAMSRAIEYLKRNERLFAARREATDKCNTICYELATLANKAFSVSQMYGLPSVIAGRLKAYADILSSMSGDLMSETE